MDIGRSLTYITEDENWPAQSPHRCLISLIPDRRTALSAGYTLKVVKNTIEGREIPLPEPTEEFGDKILKGLWVWIINVHLFPAGHRHSRHLGRWRSDPQ